MFPAVSYNIHRVAYQDGLLQTMVVDEGQYIFRHGCIVMAGVVRGFSMVSQILYGFCLFNMGWLCSSP